MNTDFKEYFSTRNGKNLANGASLFKFTFHLRRERRVFCLSEESDLVQCHCSIMHAYIYMYDNTLGGGLLMTYLQNTNINDRWLIRRGKIPKRFLASAAPARPRSSLHVQWKKEGMAEKLIFKQRNGTVLWSCLGGNCHRG